MSGAGRREAGAPAASPRRLHTGCTLSDSCPIAGLRSPPAGAQPISLALGLRSAFVMTLPPPAALPPVPPAARIALGGRVETWILYAFPRAFGLAGAFGLPAQMAVLPSLVGQAREQPRTRGPRLFLMLELYGLQLTFAVNVPPWSRRSWPPPQRSGTVIEAG